MKKKLLIVATTLTLILSLSVAAYAGLCDPPPLEPPDTFRTVCEC